MKKILVCMLVGAATLLGAGAASAKMRVNGKEVKEGNVHVLKGEVYRGDIAAKGDIIVEGMVTGDVASLAGDVTITGEVGGDVASLGGGAISVLGRVGGDVAAAGTGYIAIMGSVGGSVSAMGGHVRLGGKSSVGGDLSLLGGTLERADGARVGGEVTNIAAGALENLHGLTKKLHIRADVDKTVEALRPAARVAGLAALIIFVLGMTGLIVIAATLVPQPIERMAAAIRADFWSSCGIGTLVLIALGPAFFLLLVSILGIPLIPLAVLLVGAAKLLGVAAFGVVLVERLFENQKRPRPGTPAAAAIGFGLLAALPLLGKLMMMAGGVARFTGGVLLLAGLIVVSCAIIAGFGAAWTTRLGTR